jgi:hypothetical protein
MADTAIKACDSDARIIKWIEEVQGHDQRYVLSKEILPWH